MCFVDLFIYAYAPDWGLTGFAEILRSIVGWDVKISSARIFYKSFRSCQHEFGYLFAAEKAEMSEGQVAGGRTEKVAPCRTMPSPLPVPVPCVWVTNTVHSPDFPPWSLALRSAALFAVLVLFKEIYLPAAALPGLLLFAFHFRPPSTNHKTTRKRILSAAEQSAPT